MLLLYLVLALILVLGIVAFHTLPELGPHFLTSSLEIAITIGIVDALLRRQNRLNWITARMDARGRLLRDAADAAELLDSLSRTASEDSDWDEYDTFDALHVFRAFHEVSAKEVYQSRIANATPAARSAAMHRLQRLDSRLAFEVTHTSAFLTPEVLGSIIRLRAAIDQTVQDGRLEQALDQLLEFISVVGSPEVKLRVVDDDRGAPISYPFWLEIIGAIGTILEAPVRLIKHLRQKWKERSRW